MGWNINREISLRAWTVYQGPRNNVKLYPESFEESYGVEKIARRFSVK